MTMKEWFLAELESEAAKSRRVLEQVPANNRGWKPHDRSMELGYLSDVSIALTTYLHRQGNGAVIHVPGFKR